MTRAELKNQARNVLRGNWGWEVGIALVYEILSSMLNAARQQDQYSGLYILVLWLVVGLIGISWSYTSLALVDQRQNEIGFQGILAAVRQGRFGISLLTMVISTVFIFLWTLLLIIPGIVKTIAYSQSYFIIKDKLDAGERITATEAITTSRQLMDGHKMDYLILQLSFLGWILLGIITLGIAMLWVMPYIYTTNANFYRQLVSEKNHYRNQPEASFEEK